MGVGFGDIDREAGCILNAVVAVGGQPHQEGTAALDLDHVGNTLFKQARLGQDADHKGAVLDQ